MTTPLPILRAFVLAVLVAAGTSFAVPAHAQVPSANQALLLLRTLAYDRKLPERADKEVTIAVVYREGNAESISVQKEITSALEDAGKKTTVSGRAVRTVKLAYDPGSFDSAISRIQPNAVYLCAGLGGQVGQIVQITRAKSILTFTGTESYVDDGASIGFVRRGAKSAILVDLPSAKAEGADLDASLLKIAEVRK